MSHLALLKGPTATRWVHLSPARFSSFGSEIFSMSVFFLLFFKSLMILFFMDDAISAERKNKVCGEPVLPFSADDSSQPLFAGGVFVALPSILKHSRCFPSDSSRRAGLARSQLSPFFFLILFLKTLLILIFFFFFFH